MLTDEVLLKLLECMCTNSPQGSAWLAQGHHEQFASHWSVHRVRSCSSVLLLAAVEITDLNN